MSPPAFERSAVVRLQAERMHAGLSIRHLDDRMFGGLIDPVLMIDHFEMRQPYFPPHPHAGFSAATYLFEDSEGSFQNRDSLGDISTIGPGALHWTVAGRGVMHEEVPVVAGRRCHGLQIFFNLPAHKKLIEPHAVHVAADAMPNLTLSGARVRVVAGSFGEAQSPARLPEPANLLDIELSGNGLALPWPAGWGGVLMCTQGEIELEFAGDGTSLRLSGDECIGLRAGTAPSSLTLRGLGRVVVLQGQAWREPVFRRGPFAMDSPERLQQAMRDYAAGRMGALAPSREFPI